MAGPGGGDHGEFAQRLGCRDNRSTTRPAAQERIPTWLGSCMGGGDWRDVAGERGPLDDGCRAEGKAGCLRSARCAEISGDQLHSRFRASGKLGLYTAGGHGSLLSRAALRGQWRGRRWTWRSRNAHASRYELARSAVRAVVGRDGGIRRGGRWRARSGLAEPVGEALAGGGETVFLETALGLVRDGHLEDPGGEGGQKVRLSHVIVVP